MRFLFTAAVLALLLIGAAILAFRSGILHPADRRPIHVEVSPEAAESAQRKLEELAAERTPARLSDVEVTSLLRYRSELWSLAPGSAPVVRMSSDTVHFSGSIPTDRLPADPALDALRILLPDTARVGVSGTVATITDGELAFHIASIEVEGMPIPPRYVPAVLERLGYPQRQDLGSEVIAIPLPAGVGSARVQDGELMLTPDP